MEEKRIQSVDLASLSAAEFESLAGNLKETELNDENRYVDKKKKKKMKIDDRCPS